MDSATGVAALDLQVNALMGSFVLCSVLLRRNDAVPQTRLVA